MNQTVCEVCPRMCKLTDGAWGFCDVRAANRGSVRDMYYSAIAWPGVQVGFGMDVPHAWSRTQNKLMAEAYLPGCNLKCDFCVGRQLSRVEEIRGIQWVPPVDLVKSVVGSVDVLLFTGGEVTIHPEYLGDAFSECRKHGIYTGLESNGYMTKTTAEKLAKLTDFIAIGLKASLDREFYKSKLGAETQPILDATKAFVENDCEVILTNLTDQKLWDDRRAFEALVEWIIRNLGSEIRLVLAPMESEERIPLTPLEDREEHLQTYRTIAVEAGLYPQQIFLQANTRKLNEERREHLKKMGVLSTLEQM